MLKELVEFASQSCFDISSMKEDVCQIKNHLQSGTQNAEINEKKTRVLELIHKLRAQTEDLEKFAYENGYGGEMPLSELKQRQKFVFDKLKEKIQLNINLDSLTESELHQDLDKNIEEVSIESKRVSRLLDIESNQGEGSVGRPTPNTNYRSGEVRLLSSARIRGW